MFRSLYLFRLVPLAFFAQDAEQAKVEIINLVQADQKSALHREIDIQDPLQRAPALGFESAIQPFERAHVARPQVRLAPRHVGAVLRLGAEIVPPHEPVKDEARRWMLGPRAAD
jgi:hypothetical protein